METPTIDREMNRLITGKGGGAQLHRHLFGLVREELRGPQKEVIECFERLIAQRSPVVVTVRSARQTMKNDTAAMLQCRALSRYQYHGGSIVRTAPTKLPQIVNSRRRLDVFLQRDPFIRYERVRQRFGYIVEYGLASVQFLSTAPTANVEGATADLYLDIDEAHKADKGSFEEKFAPMTASKAVPIIMWGVAADKTDLLFEYRTYNQEQGRDRLNFNFPAALWCEILPDYARHYEERRRKLGPNNPFLLTQYDLVDQDALGGFLSGPQQEMMLDSEHERLGGPRLGYEYVVTIDIGGEAEEEVLDDEEKSEGQRDSTFTLIWEIDPERLHGVYPECRLVDMHWWTGKSLGAGPSGLPGQQEVLRVIVRRWNATAVIDARGVGEQIASYVAQRCYGVEEYKATAEDVSNDVYNTWALANNGAIKVFRNDDSPEWREFRNQMRWTQRENFGQERVRLKKPKGSRHIDAMKAMTYLPRALDRLQPIGYRMERLI